MNMLNDLGVLENTLSVDEKSFLDKNGYLSLGQILSDPQVIQINKEIKRLMDEEGENAGAELLDSKYIKHPKEAGGRPVGRPG